MKAFDGIPRMALLGFFVSHVFASTLIDVQVVVPSSIFPQALVDLLDWYATNANDPLMLHHDKLPWFQSLIYLEMIVQLPFFFWAISELSVNPKGTCLLNPFNV